MCLFPTNEMNFNYYNQFFDQNRTSSHWRRNDLIASLTYYDILGVSKTATTEKINRAYHKLCLDFHTDRNQDGLKMMQVLNRAHQTLTDPVRREYYDNTGGDQGDRDDPAYYQGTNDNWWPWAGGQNRQERQQQGMGVRMDVQQSLRPSFSTALINNGLENMANMLVDMAAAGVGNDHFMQQLADLRQVALSHASAHIVDAFAQAMKSAFICSECRKKMAMKDFCYCQGAAKTAHCNRTKCCKLTREGKLGAL